MAGGAAAIGYFGAIVGAVLGTPGGVVDGALTALIMTGIALLRPGISPLAARAAFITPTLAILAVLALPYFLILTGGNSPVAHASPSWAAGMLTGFFLVPAPLGTLLLWHAAPWCLGPWLPGIRVPNAGRRLLYAACVPLAAAVILSIVWVFL